MCTFICLQRRLCQLLAQPRVFRAHNMLRLQVEHGIGVCSDCVHRRLQLITLDLHLHLSGHVHTLLIHGTAIERGGFLVLLQLLSKLVASKKTTMSTKLDAAAGTGREAKGQTVLYLLNHKITTTTT